MQYTVDLKTFKGENFHGCKQTSLFLENFFGFWPFRYKFREVM